MKKIIVLGFIIATLFFTVISLNLVCEAKDFTDLPNTHWAYQYVSKLSDEGTINGYGDGSFKPSNPVSKAEYIKLLVACVTDEIETNYLKTSQSFHKNWFEPYFEYAYKEGFFDYKIEADELKEGTTREEMANILIGFLNNLKLKNVETVPTYSNEKSISSSEIASHYGEGEYKIVDYIPLDDITYAKVENQEEIESSNTLYNDISNLDTNSINNIYRCSNLGIMNGYDDGTFKPDKIMTRAEVSVVISRFKETIDVDDTPEYETIDDTNFFESNLNN